MVFRSLLITPIYVLLIYCVLTVGYGIKGLLIVGAIVAFIEINMYYYYFSKYVKFRFYIKDGFTPDIKKRIFSYNWQVAIIVILDSVVWTKSEVFFLGKLSTKESVAFYSLAYNLASWTVAFLPGVFTNVLYPAISEMYGKEDQQGIKKVYLHSTRYLMMFSIPACLLGMALSQEVVLLFYGKPYLDVVPVLNILLISSCVGITASPGSSVIYATERQRYILIVNIFITILNIGMNIFLISKYSAIGAAISNSLSQILAVSVVGTFLCKSMVIRFPFKDAMKIIFSSVVMFMFVKFFLKWWGGVLGLMLSIITGTSIYLYLVARLRILKESDKGILDGIQSRLPEFVQVPFNKFLLLGK